MNRQRLAAALVLTVSAALDAQTGVVTKSSVTTIAGGKTTQGEWGVPYEVHITLEVQGRQIYASLIRKSLEFEQSIKVTSIENGPLDSHVFDVPKGWKTRTR